jgi:hypothetical protein
VADALVPKAGDASVREIFNFLPERVVLISYGEGYCPFWRCEGQAAAMPHGRCEAGFNG